MLYNAVKKGFTTKERAFLDSKIQTFKHRKNKKELHRGVRLYSKLISEIYKDKIISWTRIIGVRTKSFTLFILL